MGDTTGIEWTDSTMNFWEGCTKVGPGCDHCYAEARDIRWHDGSHWGAGAPRRQMSLHTRNGPLRWQKGAAEFARLRGHPQRVFCSSLADVFDNEVPESWRDDVWATILATPDLRWQLCTKRVSNVRKMLPAEKVPDGYAKYWPRNAGLLITTVTQDEIDRDVPRLLDLKRDYHIPWVGLSVEPQIEAVTIQGRGWDANRLDWVIIGGESGSEARPFDGAWAADLVQECENEGVACFVKQMGDNPVWTGAQGTLPMQVTGKGKDMSEWPPQIRVRQFPRDLCA